MERTTTVLKEASAIFKQYWRWFDFGKIFKGKLLYFSSSSSSHLNFGNKLPSPYFQGKNLQELCRISTRILPVWGISRRTIEDHFIVYKDSNSWVVSLKFLCLLLCHLCTLVRQIAKYPNTGKTSQKEGEDLDRIYSELFLQVYSDYSDYSDPFLHLSVIGILILLVNFGRHYVNYWESKSRCLLLFIPKLMDKQSKQIRHWRKWFELILIISKMIEMSYLVL